MDNDLQKQIQDLIKASLPVAQAQAFADFFEDHKKLAKEHELLTANYLRITEERDRFSKEMKEASTTINGMTQLAETLNRKDDDLKNREIAVEERERKSDNEILKLQLQCEKEKVSLQASCLNTVFASPVYRTYVNGGKMVPNNYGGADMRSFNSMEENTTVIDHIHSIPGSVNPTGPVEK